MARSTLFRTVRSLLRRAHAVHALSVDPADAAGEASARPRGPSRRDLLLGTLGAAALVPLATACGDNGGPAEAAPGIAVIGGGMAGLTVAHFLRLAGVRADVYEASLRTGGRMYTDRTTLANGQLVELGGELVDTDHVVIQALVASHGLTLDDLPLATEGLEQDLFVFGDGAGGASGVVPIDTIIAEFVPVAAKMATAYAAGDGTDAASVAEFERIDALSIPQWLEAEAGLPTTSLIRRILEVAYLEEFGLEVAEQSAWNLITLIDFDTTDPFRIFGDSDERFHIHEGNDALPTKMATQLADRIVVDHALTAVTKLDDGYELTFATTEGAHVVRAARVVYALPFTKLREVDLEGAALSAGKREAIDELGYGTNAKLMLQFEGRPWQQAPRYSAGGAITDVGELQAVWATSRGQAGNAGILTNFVGGERGVAIGGGTAEAQAQTVLPWIEEVFPGTSATYVAGSAIRQHWPSYPFTKGSYASYKVGQWRFFGTEGAREETQHFCGEHCSEDWQGYMEGAAETGAMVAAEILDDLEVAYPVVLDRIIGTIVGARARASYHGGRGRRMRLSQIRRG